MAAPKSKTSVQGGASRRGGPAVKSTVTTTAFFVARNQALPKGATGFNLEIPDRASKVLTSNPKRMKALLQVYGNAIGKSHTAGRPVSFRVDVNPDGVTVLRPVEDVIAAPEPAAEEPAAPDAELGAALVAARERGRSRVAEILGGDDMLNAEAFAKMLGTTRVTVNTKRQNGQILGLDGAKRGFRFPVWQIDAEGKPYAELAVLHERLGGPWAVYRFLVQSHGELDGLTGREALERRRGKAALQAAESVGRDFR